MRKPYQWCQSVPRPMSGDASKEIKEAYWLESSNLSRPGRDVVYGDAAVGLRREPIVEEETENRTNRQPQR